ncbi:MAG: hypothetical protein GQ576_02645 [Methanococcoides sp.]|nr:hypothetical protein [Methanococcoides sp.]
MTTTIPFQNISCVFEKRYKLKLYVDERCSNLGFVENIPKSPSIGGYQK